jgi:glycosyltransferase involved in cell wall biosynthesis
MVMPGEGLFADACRHHGLEVRILEGTAAFKTFGKALLRLGPLGQLGVVLRELAPYARHLAALIDRERADVVHFNTARGAIMAGAGAHLARRGSVLHVRGTPGMSDALWTLAQAVPTRFILVAKALERAMLPSARRRSRVVYNGVWIPGPAPRDDAREVLVAHGLARRHVEGGAPIVLSLSSLVPFKGLHHLVRAIRELATRGVVAHFVLAGTGVGDAYEAHLKRLPEELGVADRVTFPGHVGDPTAILPGVDVLVLPSVEREVLDLEGRRIDVRGNEGLPRSVLEAMGASLPVVASDVAGVREQIEDGVSGIVVPPGDVAALTDALARTLGDAAFRASAGARGRAIVTTRFSVASAARGLVDTLEEALRAEGVVGAGLDAVQALADGARGLLARAGSR